MYAFIFITTISRYRVDYNYLTAVPVPVCAIYTSHLYEYPHYNSR